MTAFLTNSGSCLRQTLTAAVLLSILLHLTSGFSLEEGRAGHRDSHREKREVLCKANARNCDPMALVSRRSMTQWPPSATGLQGGGSEPLSQKVGNDDVLYRILQNPFSLPASLKTVATFSGLHDCCQPFFSKDVQCGGNPRTCTNSNVVRKKEIVPAGALWKRLLQNEKSSYGYGRAAVNSESQAKEQLMRSDLMNKIQTSLSKWQKLRLAAEEQPAPAFSGVANEEEFYEPW